MVFLMKIVNIQFVLEFHPTKLQYVQVMVLVELRILVSAMGTSGVKTVNTHIVGTSYQLKLTMFVLAMETVLLLINASAIMVGLQMNVNYLFVMVFLPMTQAGFVLAMEIVPHPTIARASKVAFSHFLVFLHLKYIIFSKII